MKALLLTGKKSVEYKDIPTPECPDNGLLVKIDAVGLCGSDVRTYIHGHSKVTYPAILGHENVGTIVEVGDKVEGYDIGEDTGESSHILWELLLLYSQYARTL